LQVRTKRFIRVSARKAGRFVAPDRDSQEFEAWVYMNVKPWVIMLYKW